MSRKKLPPAENASADVDESALQKATDAMTQLAAMQPELQEAEEAGAGINAMTYGAMLEALGQASQIAGYEKVKKSRGWKNRVNPKTGRFFESLDEFCEVRIGYTRRRMDQLLTNRNTIGPALYEHADKIGLRQKDFDAIKALPAPDQELIRRATEEAESRDQVLDILHELAAKHGREKETTEKKIADLSADLEAREQIIQKKDEKLNKMHKDLLMSKKRAKTWNGRAFDIAMESTEQAFYILQATDQLDLLRDAILTEDFGEDDREQAVAAMANVYYDAVRQIFIKSSELMAACEQVFSGYKDTAIPLIEMESLFGAEAVQQAMERIKD